MKKFFGEFKKFITRGNVLDMAVGVIVGGAFTAIVNGLSNYILRPIINWLLALVLGQNSLSSVFTYLKFVPSAENPAVADLSQSIYIDWGAFINAIINFLLIALVLFSIVKIINTVKEKDAALKEKHAKGKLTKEDKKELKARGIKKSDKEAVKAFLAEKEAEELAKKEAEEQKAKEEEEEAKKHTTEGLLESIKELLEKSAK